MNPDILHPERRYTKHKTAIFYETSKHDPNEPYYPINTEKNHDIFLKYKELAQKEKGVIIGGRLGEYAYYDMDKTILSVLKCYEEKVIKNKK